MSLWFETAVKSEKMQNNGTVKAVTEKFLFDALSFSEAEEKTIQKMTPRISGEFTVRTAKRTKIAEILNIGADKYYLCKVGFITMDEKSGVEKMSISQILVGADNFNDAYSGLLDGMKDTMADYAIVSIAESPILEVFPHEFAKSEENS